MGPVKAASVLAMLLIPIAAPARLKSDPVAQWRPYITEASARFDVPADWIERVIRAESAGLTTLDGQPIRSKAGAIGLMQLMPATWTAMRLACHLGPDPGDPHDNIIAGAAFLRSMRERFGYPGLFAAYNAGPARYAAYLAGRSHLPSETIRYLGGVAGQSVTLAATRAQSPRELLFALRHDLDDGPKPTQAGSKSDSVFAVQHAYPSP